MAGPERKGTCRGQSLLDFVILISIVSVVFFAMNSGMRRGVQAVIKTAADYIGGQQESEQDFGEDSTGYLVGSVTNVRTNRTMNSRNDAGVASYDTAETRTTMSETLINQGVVESPD